MQKISIEALARQQIAAAVAVENVVACFAVDRVGALGTEDRVATTTGLNRVVTTTSVKGLARVITFDIVGIRGAATYIVMAIDVVRQREGRG